MNCSVSEFFLDDDRNLVDTFGDETVELLWDNGPVFRRTSQEEFRSRCGISGSSAGEPFLEDEMASWLNYPLIYGEERGTVGSDQPTIAAPLDCEVLKTQQKFFRPLESGGSTIEQGEHSSGGKGETSSILISETEGSDPSNPGLDSRKRKEPEAEDSDSINESIEKHDDGRKSALKRRLRAAEVHNLSERRRRDRINEKMKALQELLPRCNKSDKASMLDDAIRYLKFLQSQVQMMAMSYNMFPMMVPGIHNHYHSNRHHQFLPQMGMAMPMGLNMGLGMRSFNGPLPPPFFPVLSGPRMGPPRATHLSQGSLPTVDPAVAHSGQHQSPMFPQERSTAGQLADLIVDFFCRRDSSGYCGVSSLGSLLRD